MPPAIDPTLRRLDDCGCCKGVTAETPAPIDNRPGLTAIAYRAGTHASFKASMFAEISASDTVALRALQTRDDDDFTVALTDSWAMALDVLTFYQERLANESYLRTATERLSVAELARLIGYEPRPGLAASTRLAFTLEQAAGAPAEVTLAPGLRVQSIPGPDEAPQTFETVEEITARPAWNAMPARAAAPQALSPAMGTLWLEGTGTNLKTGDQVLIIAGAGALLWAMRRVATVTPDDAASRTRVQFEPLDYGPLPAQAGATPGVWALRSRAAPFGHNAQLKPPPDKPADIENSTEWGLSEPNARILSLDAVYDQVRPDSWLVIERSWYYIGWLRGLPATSDARVRLLRRASQVRVASRAAYGLTGRVTQLTLDDDWLDGFEWSAWWLRETAVFARSELLPVAEAPLVGTLPANALQLAGDFSDLSAGRHIVVSGKAPGVAQDAPMLHELATIKAVAVSGAITTLTLEANLATAFDRQTVTVNANVALATHGETVSEVLGSGNARQAYQQFALRGSPLTYLSAVNPAGAAPELEVRVNDLLWQSSPTLYGHGPAERIYVLRQEGEGRTTVEFGDGATGARLPTGSEQVRATYRKGLGKGGNLKAGQLSLLMTRPLGVKEVLNPAPAEGGSDPEPRDHARANAPLTVLTIGRVVSLRDYEDFARGFAGIAKALASWTWGGQRQGIIVTVAGEGGAAVPETGETCANLVAALRAYGDPYVPLRLSSYAPRGFVLAATITRTPDGESKVVEATVRAALLAAFAFDARQFGQAVALSEVMAIIQAVPGVAGVDVDALHRLDLVGGAGLQSRVPAFAPRPGAAAAVEPAELLTLADADITLAVT
ncbi:MAG: putative baseplate assembly protein [Chloroflexi bacterium]|nr:putative baseplate assembly protein [Chloroflexota bacterium]